MSNLANEFKTDYKIQMPLSGVAMSSFERNGTLNDSSDLSIP